MSSRIACGALLSFAAIGAAPSARAAGTCGAGGPTGKASFTFEGKTVYVRVPTDAKGPLPLVLALHGDEGNAPYYILHYWNPFWEARQDFILLAPSWGGSWWRDYEKAKPWMERMLDKVIAEYNVDVDRIYGTGVSGGSTFLGGFAPVHQNMFAAIQFSCGGAGVPEYVEPPRKECKFAARFVLAKDDFMVAYARPLYTKLEKWEHAPTWIDAPCSGHCCGPVTAYVDDAWAFFASVTRCRSLTPESCGAVSDWPPPAGGEPPVAEPGAGAEAPPAEADGSDAGAADSGPGGSPPPGPGEDDTQPAGGCGCTLPGSGSDDAGAAAFGLAALALLIGRRQPIVL